MWRLVYYIFISIAGMLFLPVWLLKARRKGRAIWPCLRLGLKSQAMPCTQGGIWLHALSVGEVNSALPLARALKDAYPNVPLYFSVATYTGYKLARSKLKGTAWVLARPLDVPWAVHKWLKRLAPSLFILVESDMWPAWQSALRLAGATCVLVNARISPRTLAGYSKCRALARLLYKDFAVICVQSELDRERLQSIGVYGAQALGNLKFDSLPAPLNEERRAACARGLGLSYPANLLVAGSTHEGEEEACLNAWQSLCQQGFEDLILLLAPRDISRARQIAAMLPPGQAWRASQGPMPAKCNVLILDVMGKLADSYALAKVAFIGGSLAAQGGHNPLEAAIQGVAVVFGPHMEDFRQMADGLLEAGAACQINNPRELLPRMRHMLTNESETANQGVRGRAFCLQHQGAVNHIMAALPLSRLN